MPEKKPRLSLTKSQLQSAAGAELLALCQSVTEDGVLTNDEILLIRDWLDRNKETDLPAISFLTSTVEEILADGKVTPEERLQLYKAIETVLPPEARKGASGRRKAVEAAVRERDRGLIRLNFMVAGVYYEGRPAIIERHAREDDQVYLVRDPANRFSRNAVEIRLANGMQIGFVPEEYATDVAPLLNDGCPHYAYITTILTRGRSPIPVVQAEVFRKDAEVARLVFPSDVPDRKSPEQGKLQYGRKAGGRSILDVDFEKRSPMKAKKSGCLGMLLLLGIIPVMLAFGLAWG